MPRNYKIGDADAASGVAASATAPNAGKTVVIPDGADFIDGPKAFIEFANSLPTGLPSSLPADVGKALTVQANGSAAWQKLFAEIVASATPPAIVRDGQAWYDLNSADLFISVGGAWIDTVNGSGRGGMHVGDTPQAIKSDGQTWLDTVSGHLFVSYNNQWVDMSGAS